jgi:DNA-binding CsgD family transcriptional regulator
MRTLRTSDLTALAELIDSLLFVAPGEVPGRLVAGVLDVVPGVLASYNEFGRDATHVAAAHPAIPTPGADGVFIRFQHQHPVIAVHGPTGIHPARTISDYATARQVRRLDLYQALYRPLGIADQITSNAAGPGGITIGLAICRAGWGFTDRDRLLLDLLHPFLSLGPARAARLQRIAQCHRALAGDPAHAADSLVVLTRRRRIAWMTPPARRMLVDWFGYGGGSELPAELSSALAQRGEPARASRPARLTRGDRTLVVTPLVTGPGDPEPLLALTQMITLSPERLAALGLTSREGEILRAAADGLAESAIAARLAVSQRTVNTHLEHIYRKLGATGRRQAVAAAFAGRLS